MSARLILIGALPPPIDGQSMAFQMLVDGLRDAGEPFEVIGIGRPSETFARSATGRVFDYARALARFAGALRRNAQATVYLTVAQSRAGFLRDCAFVGLARIFRRSVVIHVHGGNYDGFYAAQSRALRWVVRRMLCSTERILVLAERLRSMFDFDPSLASRIRVVPNGLPGDVPAFSPISPPTGGEPLRLLFLSNLIESKGYLESIMAVAILGRRGVQAELELCGEFRLNPSDDRRVSSVEQAHGLVEELVRADGLESRVHLRGTVSGEAKRVQLSRCHVLVLPTRYDNEGQPLSIIEAMAWGRPVVTTDYRGIPDLVEDEVSGFLLEAPDPEALADRLYRLATEPGLLESMGVAARTRFEAHFTGAAHVRSMRTELSLVP
ncbi:MAG: glycosyltransferase [Myxococcota bacterium]